MNWPLLFPAMWQPHGMGWLHFLQEVKVVHLWKLWALALSLPAPLAGFRLGTAGILAVLKLEREFLGTSPALKSTGSTAITLRSRKLRCLILQGSIFMPLELFPLLGQCPWEIISPLNGYKTLAFDCNKCIVRLVELLLGKLNKACFQF